MLLDMVVFLNALFNLREWLRDFFRGGPIPLQGTGNVGPHAPPPGPGDAGGVHGIPLSTAGDLNRAPGNFTNNGTGSGVEPHAPSGSLPVAPFGALPHDEPWNPFQDLRDQVDPQTTEDTGALARDLTARAFQKGSDQHDISPVPPTVLDPPQQEGNQVQEVPQNGEGPLLGGVNAVERQERGVAELQRKNAKHQFQERERLRVQNQLSKRAGAVPGIGVGHHNKQSQSDPLNATSTSALTTPVEYSVADHDREDTFKTVAHKAADFLRKIVKNVPKP